MDVVKEEGTSACGPGLRLRPLVPASHKHLGERVGAGAADVAPAGVEGHVVDGLVQLPAVGGELLDAGPALQVPQADGAVVTWTHSQSEGRKGRKGRGPARRAALTS